MTLKPLHVYRTEDNHLVEIYRIQNGFRDRCIGAKLNEELGWLPYSCNQDGSSNDQFGSQIIEEIGPIAYVYE